MSYTINLGSNIITDCLAVLVVEGVEVFRLRDRDGDGQLVVDFDIRNIQGEKLAVVAKNNVVFAADGFSFKNQPSESIVQDGSGRIYARVQELSTGRLSVQGEFCVNGFAVSITDRGIKAGGLSLSGNRVFGARKAIVLTKTNCSLGSI